MQACYFSWWPNGPSTLEQFLVLLDLQHDCISVSDVVSPWGTCGGHFASAQHWPWVWPSEPNLCKFALLSSPTQVPDLSLAKSFICDRYNLSKNNLIITLVSQSHTVCVLYWHTLKNLETILDIFYFNVPLLFRILVVPFLAFAKSFPRSLLPQSSTLPFSLLILARKLCVKSRTNPTASLLKTFLDLTVNTDGGPKPLTYSLKQKTFPVAKTLPAMFTQLGIHFTFSEYQNPFQHQDFVQMVPPL